MSKLRAALLGAALAVSCALPAQADPPPQAAALCADAPRGCGITIANATREGATFPMTIHGRPETRVKVVIYQALVDEQGQLTDLIPIGNGRELLIGQAGVTNADLAIPGVVTEPSSGWALISVDGVTGTNTSMTVGQFLPFGARRPTVLGDGYGEQKPVGQVLDLSLIGAIPGSRFAVEIRQGDDDAWQDITVGEGRVMDDANEVSTIQYEIPRGLTSSPKQIRLRNVSDSAVAALSLAVPSPDGEPKPLNPVFVPPPVGDALDGTSELAAHPTDTVRVTSYAIGGTALVFVAGAVVWPMIARRREASR